MTVNTGLPHRSISNSSSRRAFTDREEERIARAYEEDESWTQRSLAEAVGVSQGTIQALLERQRVDPRGKRARRGPDHPMWTGGIQYSSNGYEKTWIPEDHPLASMRQVKGYVLTHRLRMAEHLGRPLRPDETVHHVDGNKLNNGIDNLQLRTGNHGSGIVLKCLDCGSTNFEAETLR